MLHSQRKSGNVFDCDSGRIVTVVFGTDYFLFAADYELGQACLLVLVAWKGSTAP